jgi:hypothetical protein
LYYETFEKRGSDAGVRGIAFFFGIAFIIEVLLILQFGVDQLAHRQPLPNDVFLVLEATIGFNKRAKGEGSDDVTSHGLQSGEMKLKVTAQDLKFLRSLKISVENLDQQQ